MHIFQRKFSYCNRKFVHVLMYSLKTWSAYTYITPKKNWQYAHTYTCIALCMYILTYISYAFTHVVSVFSKIDLSIYSTVHFIFFSPSTSFLLTLRYQNVILNEIHRYLTHRYPLTRIRYVKITPLSLT